MKKHVKKWAMFTLRWGIAVVGIWFVLQNISWRTSVLVANPTTGRPTPVQLVGPMDEHQASFRVLSPFVTPDKLVETDIPRTDVLVRPGLDVDKAIIHRADGTNETMELLALRVSAGDDRRTWPVIVGRPRTLWERYFNKAPARPAETIAFSQIEGFHPAPVPYPLVELSIGRIISQANGWYLLLAVVVFPVTFVLVSARWALLLRALGITISNSRTFVLTMVGLFYNNFMPGSTGGDLIKAYYASKNTPKRTQVILSVLIDRIIGLLALIILGGTMAAIHWEIPQCRKIAIGSAVIIAMVASGLIVFYVPFLRRVTGLNMILKRLPMQKQVNSAVNAMELYGQRPGIMLTALVMSFPVHMTCIVSAIFAGKAFGLPLSPSYYWVAVPVIVLSGAIPISPQGAGVMEYFAILLTKRQGCTVTHAVLLTMSIRLVQMLWNLSGAFFVFRGGYAAPKEPTAAVEAAVIDG
ncbi:hypothetical protein BH10PLA1_BH10PLA1_21550 [soil metagenome]